jgi:hypothetical protein
VSDAQRPLRQLDQSIARTGTTAERSSRLLDLPAQSLDRTSTSADRAVRNLRNSSSELRTTGDSAQQAQRGVGGLRSGVSGLTGALGALGVSLGAVQLAQFGAQALSAANDLETTQATVRALAGDQATYNEILRLAEDQQRRYGGSLSDNIAQLGSLSNSARNAGVGIGEINEAAQRLLVLDPSAQFEDAAIALREALSGDITSLAERFELSRRELAALTDESLSGAEKLAVLDNLLTDLGATSEAVDARLQTNAQAFRDASAEVEQLTTSLGGLIQRGLTPAARGLGLVANRTNTAISALSDMDSAVEQLQQGTDAYNALSEASREFQGASEDTQSLYQAERDALEDLEETQRRQIERITELESGLRNPASRLRPELRSAYEEELEQLYEATRTTGDRIEQRSRDLTHVLQAEAEMQAGTFGEVGDAAQLSEDEIEEYQKTLADAFSGGRDAFQDALQTEREFLQERKTARIEHGAEVAEIEADYRNDLAALETEFWQASTDEERGAIQEQIDNLVRSNADRIAAQEAAFTEQEQAAAEAYARQQAEQLAHLGQMLIDYTTAQARMAGINEETITEMTDALRQEYGVQTSIVDRSYGEMTRSIDQWVASGGENTQQYIDQQQRIRNQTVETQQRVDAAIQQMTDAATEDFQNGEISAQEYADRLAEIPGEAERAAAGVNSSLDTIPREIVTVHRIEEVGAAAATGTTDAAARAAKGGGQKEPKKRAIGGPVQAGDVYTVGETGRELFVPGQDGRIVPNRMTEDILSGMQGATAPMASGGGGTGSITINISNPVVDNAARLQEMAGMIGSKVQSAVWGQFGAALDDLAAQGVP